MQTRQAWAATLTGGIGQAQGHTVISYQSAELYSYQFTALQTALLHCCVVIIQQYTILHCLLICMPIVHIPVELKTLGIQLKYFMAISKL